MPLSPEPARDDLTDRECAKLIGATIGGLIHMAPLDNIQRAVRWWAALPPHVWAEVEAMERRHRGADD